MDQAAFHLCPEEKHSLHALTNSRAASKQPPSCSNEQPKPTNNNNNTPVAPRGAVPPRPAHLVPENHRVDEVGQPQRELPDEPLVLERVVQQLVRDVEHLEDQPGALLGDRQHAPRGGGSGSGGGRRQRPGDAAAATAVPAPACSRAVAARRTPRTRDNGASDAVPAGAADRGPWLPSGDRGGVEAVQGLLEDEKAGFLRRAVRART